MMNTNELIENRSKKWSAAKAFYESHINENGCLNDEDVAVYKRMEDEVQSLGKQISIYQTQNNLEDSLKKPTSTPITERPHRTDGKIYRSDKSYNTYFWDMLRGVAVENALQLADDTEGGYLVPDSFERTLISALEDENIVRALAHKLNTNMGQRRIPFITAHGTASWISEGSPTLGSDEVFGQIWFDAYKMGAMIKVSDELLDESGIDIENYLAGEFARRFGRTEEEAFINGNGINKPTGLLHDTEGAQLGVTTAESTITADEIIDLVYSLRLAYRKNAVFLVNESTMKHLIKIKTGTGEYLWGQVLRNGIGSMLGYPVYTTPTMPEIAPGNKAVLFGDLSYYWIADRKDRTFKRLNELFASTGQVGFIANQRLDAKLIMPEACKVLQIIA